MTKIILGSVAVNFKGGVVTNFMGAGNNFFRCLGNKIGDFSFSSHKLPVLLSFVS